MPDIEAWVAGWTGLTISGVTVLSYPALKVDTAQGAVAWPELPETRSGQMAVSCVDNNKRRRMFFVVVLGKVGTDVQTANYPATIALMKSLETAVDSLRGTLVSFLDYTIYGRADIRLGNVTYWGLEVDATGSNMPFG